MERSDDLALGRAFFRPQLADLRSARPPLRAPSPDGTVQLLAIFHESVTLSYFTGIFYAIRHLSAMAISNFVICGDRRWIDKKTRRKNSI
jgi:hypothetical protein